MKMEPISCPETSGPNQLSTLLSVSEERISQVLLFTGLPIPPPFNSALFL